MNFRSSSLFFGLFCVSSFLFLQVPAQQLQNPCRHNEFRCQDGSKCLRTEKLCDGTRDCPKGEDERGSPQWDCTKITLSTDCDQITQTKCRYGGCISKDKQCNGVPDCWGGNDESIELCPPDRNSNFPPFQKPTRGPPVFPEQRTTIRYPRPPANNPPKVPQNTGGGSSGCPPLNNEPEGFKISCVFGYESADCVNARNLLPVGTKATYTCKDFYKAPQIGSRHRERVCQKDGYWSPLRRNFFCSLDCGDGGYDQASLIVGGVTSKEGKWPWQAALYQENPPNSGNWEYYCGGSLISQNAVLTAAHCATVIRTSEAREPRDIRVMLGKFYRSFGTKEKYMQMHRVKYIMIHDYYNSMTVDNDIAIIFLDKNAEMTSRVHAVCLPDPRIDLVQPDDEYLGHLAGWGRAVNNEFKEELQETKLPVVSTTRCREAHPTLASIIRKTTFCAGYRNGTSACDGDSGSALVFRDNNHLGKFKVQGIVSAGIPKPGGGCQNFYYTVFTKVVEYREWIDSSLDRFSRR